MRPAYAFFLGAGIASVVGAASGAGVYLALKSEPQIVEKKPAAPVETVAAPAPAADPCDKQAWPHFDRKCLEHKAETASRAPRNVGTDNPVVKPAEVAAAPASPAPAGDQAMPAKEQMRQPASQAASAPPSQPAAVPPAQAAPPPQAAAAPPAQAASPPPAQPAPAPRVVEQAPPATQPVTTGAAPAEPQRPVTQPATPATSAPPSQAQTAPAQERMARELKRKERKEREARKQTPRDAGASSTGDSALAEVEAELDAMARRGELKGRMARERDGESRRRSGEGRGPIVRRWTEPVSDDDDDVPTSRDGRRFIILRSDSRADTEREWPFSR